MCARRHDGFGIQARPVGNPQGVDVVRRVLVLPRYYAYVRQHEEETAGRNVVSVQLEFSCVNRSLFNALNGPPFPAMNTLARRLLMRNVTMSVAPDILAQLNGSLALREDEMVDDGGDDEARAIQRASLVERNWVELRFRPDAAGPCIPVTVRRPRAYDDPSRIDIDPDESVGYVNGISRVRPPSTLIRLRQFADPDRAGAG